MRNCARRRKKSRRNTAVLFCAVAVLLLASCKKEKQPEEGAATATPSVTQTGFAAANEALVKQRAKENAETVAVWIGETEISMEKAMFLIYSMEKQGNSYAEYYESQYGTDYWSMPYGEDGHTTREVFKKETIDALIQYAVLYDSAINNGIGLTAEEKSESLALVEEMKASLTAEETERGGFTTDNLRETFRWMLIGEKYYGKMTDSLGITKDKIREKINKEEYKEYETEYLYLSTSYYDEDYNLCQEDASVKQERIAQMREYYRRVEEGATFAELTAENEALVHKTRTFLAEGRQAEEEYMAAATQLSVEGLSAPVQTEYGVYLIRMVDDDCTKTYEATVEAEYELQRSEAFEAAYEVLLEQYEVKVNDAAWKDIVLGATVSLLE